MSTLRQFQSFDRPVQVLLANMLVNNTAFYMLLPFVAGHMAGTLGFAASAVGLVLGTRAFSQQGMFLVGGTLSDRVGYKPVIIVGCFLRAIGFALFGLLDSLPGLIFAAALSGFAAALSTPSARAYLALESGARRPEAFALLNVTLQTGSLLGPAIGAALLLVDFRLVSLSAGGLFLVLSMLQWLYLPARLGESSGPAQRSVLGDWHEVIGNRAFVLFALSMVGYFTLYNQIYLAFALEVRRLTGNDSAVGALFGASAVAGIFLQVPLATFAITHWGPARSLATGLLLMGCGALPPLLLGHVLPIQVSSSQTLTVGSAVITSEALSLAALVVSVLLSVISYGFLVSGDMFISPFSMDMVTRLGNERTPGTYIGMYYLVQGVGATAGSVAVGGTLDLVAGGAPGFLPWLMLLAIGVISAGCVSEVNRGGLLEPSIPPGEFRVSRSTE